MMSKPQILAIVLNWNEFEVTVRCLESLRAQTLPCGILLIDNHSVPDPTPSFRQLFPGIKVFRTESNLGVAGGRNIGVRFALSEGYDFALFFDNDAVADGNMLACLFEAAKRHGRAGMFGPKIYCIDRPETIWRAGCTSWKWSYLHAGSVLFERLFSILGRTLPPFLDTLRGDGQIDTGQFDGERDLDFQIGCVQLIRISVFKDAGLLDEAFSPYGSEDIEFCARIRKRGWSIRFVPGARCWHRVGGSFRDDFDRPYFNHRNILLLARKHLEPLYFFAVFLPDYLFLTLPFTILDTFLKGMPMKREAILQALRWNLRDMRRRGILLPSEPMS